MAALVESDLVKAIKEVWNMRYLVREECGLLCETIVGSDRFEEKLNFVSDLKHKLSEQEAKKFSAFKQFYDKSMSCIRSYEEKFMMSSTRKM